MTETEGPTSSEEQGELTFQRDPIPPTIQSVIADRIMQKSGLSPDDVGVVQKLVSSTGAVPRLVLIEALIAAGSTRQDAAKALPKILSAIRHHFAPVINVSNDPKKRRDGGVWWLNLEGLLPALSVDKSSLNDPKITTPPITTVKEPNKMPKTSRETADQKLQRAREDRALAIQALEASLAGRFDDDDDDDDDTVEPQVSQPIKVSSQILPSVTMPQPPTIETSTPRTPSAKLTKNRSEVNLREALAKIYQEITGSDQKVVALKNELPWLQKDEGVRLALFTLKETGNLQFYCGSLIRGALTEEAQALTKEQNKHTDGLLYTHLPGFIKRDSRAIKTLTDPVSKKSIYYLGNKQGQRVYFMEYGRINNIPVIIRIAVCDKARQDEVLSVLTNDSRSIIKSKGKL